MKRKLLIGLLFFVTLMLPSLSYSQELEDWGGVNSVVSKALVGRFEYKAHGETIGLYTYLVYCYHQKTDSPHRFLIIEHGYAIGPCPPLPEKGDKVWIKWKTPTGEEKIGEHECIYTSHKYRTKYMVFDGEFWDAVILAGFEKGYPMVMTKLRYLTGGEPNDFTGTESVGRQTFKQNHDYYLRQINRYFNNLSEREALKEKVKKNPTHNF